MEDKLLDLLSKLGPEQKICLKSLSIVDANSWTGSLYRYWNDENREDLLVELRKLVDYLPPSSERVSPSSELEPFHDSPLPERILPSSEETIRQAIEGLNNLLITYQSDPFYCHEIMLIRKEFESRCKKNLPTSAKEKEGPFIPLLYGNKPIFVIGVGDSRNLGNYTAIATIISKHVHTSNTGIKGKSDGSGRVTNN
ncbi:hypothetical protein BQ9231_00030 [Cedratvirus lausannensis]|uniref:Uncharacterized protein n=1 Tax=Cedratvirus lausannensis TaxID=2023205 RepID=A0A285PW86_9VIRU|nr:hypothetical protein BQ9231_00030 [Cedratvirus lausannensis]